MNNGEQIMWQNLLDEIPFETMNFKIVDCQGKKAFTNHNTAQAETIAPDFFLFRHRWILDPDFVPIFRLI